MPPRPGRAPSAKEASPEAAPPPRAPPEPEGSSASGGARSGRPVQPRSTRDVISKVFTAKPTKAIQRSQQRSRLRSNLERGEAADTINFLRSPENRGDDFVTNGASASGCLRRAFSRTDIEGLLETLLEFAACGLLQTFGRRHDTPREPYVLHVSTNASLDPLCSKVSRANGWSKCPFAASGRFSNRAVRIVDANPFWRARRFPRRRRRDA